ncbi:uncharacterized protein LOC109853304 [Pseudomyrmex gracilis]|uniref:uncharacterized protein LOC109853304 n=1 Tax=Pseudomyrmex gracilis TaxID=219809 RepID=UPI000995D695|nr:uncharacterized protein LOC109853304 [Pseudomyrmex gracilis]
MEESKNKVQHLNDVEYVKFAKEAFDRKLFPDDFDNRTLREQCTWITENSVKVFPNIPQSLVNLLPASYHEINYDRSLLEKPIWLDMNKYRRGHKFVNDHYGSVAIAMLLGIMQVYSFDYALKPMIVSKRSDTPYLGFKRYLSTVRRILSWFNGEPWIKGTAAYNDMQYARKMHYFMRKQLRELTHEEIDNLSNIAEPWCPDRELLLKDFAAACPFQKIEYRPYIVMSKSSHKPKGINNADSAVVQCSFASMVLLFSQYLGIHDATDEDLEAFAHMWRCYGYCLGIEDEYNFCRGSLDEIKQRTRDVYEKWIIYNLKDISPEWEHMTRCLVESVNYYPLVYAPYKVVVLLSTDILNLNMSNLYASLSFAEWIAYKSWTFLLRHGLKVSFIRYIFNKIMHNVLNAAANFSSEKLAKIQEQSNKQLKKTKA